MTFLDLSFPTPEENLACDEALFLEAEQGVRGETLRLWETSSHFVVLGYSNCVTTEVNGPECGERSIPLLRRCTGGGTVLQGPGVLNYAVVLRADVPPFETITGANRAIMERHRDVLAAICGAKVEVEGHTDLAIAGLKFSGNSQRRGKRFLLFHGSFLLWLDLRLVERALRLPSKRPAYRRNRSHTDFLVNLELPADRIKPALRESWSATEPAVAPARTIARLVEEKYARDDWNFKFP